MVHPIIIFISECLKKCMLAYMCKYGYSAFLPPDWPEIQSLAGIGWKN